MDKKLTDNEIVKDCKNCIRYTTCIFCIIGGRSISKDCNDFVELDTINRLQAENERLEADLTRVCAERDARICTNNFIRVEAYKEFVEKLCESRVSNDNTVILAKCLLKELIGE